MSFLKYNNFYSNSKRHLCYLKCNLKILFDYQLKSHWFHFISSHFDIKILNSTDLSDGTFDMMKVLARGMKNLQERVKDAHSERW